MALSHQLSQILKKGKVSEADYRELCEKLARHPEAYDRESAQDTDTGEIPHAVSDAISDSDLPWHQLLAMWFDVYADMPCYGLLMNLRWWEKEAPEEVRSKVWAKYAEYLAGDDERLAAPIEYVLSVDYFEDPNDVADAWSRLVTETASPRVLQRVLEVSGPVPYALKAHLHETLIDDPAWHPHILQSLYWSRFTVLGDIDEAAAQKVLARLRLPEETPGLAKLRLFLGP